MKIRLLRSFVVFGLLFIIGMMNSSVYSIAPGINQIAASRQNKHIVANGETVYSIAKAYNVSVESINAANPSSSGGIRVGEKLIIPSVKATASTDRKLYNYKYTVKPQETLYSLSRKLGLTVEEIIAQNPELKNQPLQDGQVLTIYSPRDIELTNNSSRGENFLRHKVESKETLFGISKKYGTTPEALIAFNPSVRDTLREGDVILIPIRKTSSQVEQTTLLDVRTPKIGIVLPFNSESKAQSARFLEYYEGLLLSLEKMKGLGFSANLFVFDIGSETGITKLQSLLETSELKNLDLIIGGVSSEQIDILSNFSKDNGIKYVIPFPTRSTVIKSNPYVFQINEDQPVLFRNVSNVFASKFSKSNIVILTSHDDKKDFATNISSYLSAVGSVPKIVVVDSELSSKLSQVLDASRNNVIVVASGSSSVLRSVLSTLNVIKTKNSGLNITLFGQPDWQTHTANFSEFAKYDTYIYSPFYLNEYSTDTKNFILNYKKWYKDKNLINTYPKYGASGYDTGLYFFTAFLKYGKRFESNLAENTVNSLQTPFSFMRVSSTGGYLNTGFYFIHYNLDGSIDKTAYAQK